jgi:hypothetical protein
MGVKWSIRKQMLTNQSNKQIHITIDNECWQVTGPTEPEQDDLLNLIDDGLDLIIQAREILAHLRYD